MIYHQGVFAITKFSILISKSRYFTYRRNREYIVGLPKLEDKWEDQYDDEWEGPYDDEYEDLYDEVFFPDEGYESDDEQNYPQGEFPGRYVN